MCVMKRIGLLFYVRKAKMLSDGSAPVYVRITIDEQRFEFSTKRTVNPARWNAAAQKLNGTTEEVRTINACFKTLEQKIYEAFQQLSAEGVTVTAEELKNKLTGKDTKPFRSLVAIFEDHNRQVEALVGREFAA